MNEYRSLRDIKFIYLKSQVRREKKNNFFKIKREKKKVLEERIQPKHRRIDAIKDDRV